VRQARADLSAHGARSPPDLLPVWRVIAAAAPDPRPKVRVNVEHQTEPGRLDGRSTEIEQSIRKGGAAADHCRYVADMWARRRRRETRQNVSPSEPLQIGVSRDYLSDAGSGHWAWLSSGVPALGVPSCAPALAAPACAPERMAPVTAQPGRSAVPWVPRPRVAPQSCYRRALPRRGCVRVAAGRHLEREWPPGQQGPLRRLNGGGALPPPLVRPRARRGQAGPGSRPRTQRPAEALGPRLWAPETLRARPRASMAAVKHAWWSLWTRRGASQGRARPLSRSQ
jgi:hypothetical protein